MTVDNHEEYLNPPIALVAVETRFPGEIGNPLPVKLKSALAEELGEDWVFQQVQQLVVPVGGNGANQVITSVPTGAIVRFVNRELTMSIALTEGSLTVETTRYRGWPDFRLVLDIAIRATEKLLRPTGIIRAGMRYINEVRVEGVENSGWNEWLSPSVLLPANDSITDAGWVPTFWTSSGIYQNKDDRQLVLRFGPQQSEFIVNPEGPLTRPGTRPEGSFFLLDLDASWRQPNNVPKWDSIGLLEIYAQLRQPIRALFDEIITQRLVDEVFNRKEND